MNYDENKKQQQAMAAWLETREFTVFGTLKFTNGFAVHDARGEKLVRQYFCALDRTYYGNAVNNTGMRHNRVVFKHMGTSRENLHYHFLAKPHTDPALFAQLAKKQWAKMGSWTAGWEKTEIDLVRCNTAASKYMVHEFNVLGADSICLPASSFTAAARNPLQFRNLAQMRRLLILQQYDIDENEDSVSDDNALYTT
jgi:hypothetical protein